MNINRKETKNWLEHSLRYYDKVEKELLSDLEYTRAKRILDKLELENIDKMFNNKPFEKPVKESWEEDDECCCYDDEFYSGSNEEPITLEQELEGIIKCKNTQIYNLEEEIKLLRKNLI